MPATITQVVKQFQQHWTGQLAPEAILMACRGVAYQWRERARNPVTTIRLFLVQIRHGNTACTHLRHLTKLQVTASAYCQARMKLPRAVFQQLLRSVSNALQHEPLDEGRWCGHRTFWVDGSSCSMQDTPALQDHFGQNSAPPMLTGYGRVRVSSVSRGASSRWAMRSTSNPTRQLRRDDLQGNPMECDFFQ